MRLENVPSNDNSNILDFTSLSPPETMLTKIKLEGNCFVFCVLLSVLTAGTQTAVKNDRGSNPSTFYSKLQIKVLVIQTC